PGRGPGERGGPRLYRGDLPGRGDAAVLSQIPAIPESKRPTGFFRAAPHNWAKAADTIVRCCLSIMTRPDATDLQKWRSGSGRSGGGAATLLIRRGPVPPGC